MGKKPRLTDGAVCLDMVITARRLRRAQHADKPGALVVRWRRGEANVMELFWRLVAIVFLMGSVTALVAWMLLSYPIEH